MNGAIFHAQCGDAPARAVLIHDQIHREVLHKELDVVLHGLPIQCVQHGMASAVSSTGAAVCLTTTPKVKALATKSALVDLAVLSA